MGRARHVDEMVGAAVFLAQRQQLKKFGDSHILPFRWPVRCDVGPNPFALSQNVTTFYV
jgi:hypothetical protein